MQRRLDDVDGPVDLLFDAVPAGTRTARLGHAAQGPYLALLVRDLPAVPVDRRRTDRPDATSRARRVRPSLDTKTAPATEEGSCRRRREGRFRPSRAAPRVR